MSQLADLHQTSKEAKEVKRYRNQKSKWARGVRPLPGRSELRDDGRARPASQHPNASAPRYVIEEKPPRSANWNALHRDAQEAINSRHDDDYLLFPPADPDVHDYHPDIFYSFDARRSPNRGEDTLSVALARALDRFDTKETEKLVREYEFVSESEGSDCGERTVDEDDDYEIVDFVKL